jgi:CubicO group peptidase (beta-lactamase class C family)
LADGGFNATLRDFARFGELILNNGRIGDDSIVPSFWIDQLCSNCDPSAHGNPYSILSPDGAYRHFWWIHDPHQRKFMARGVFGQLIYIDQINEFVAVKPSTWPDYLIPAFSSDAISAVEAISRVVND